MSNLLNIFLKSLNRLTCGDGDSLVDVRQNEGESKAEIVRSVEFRNSPESQAGLQFLLVILEGTAAKHAFVGSNRFNEFPNVARQIGATIRAIAARIRAYRRSALALLVDSVAPSNLIGVSPGISGWRLAKAQPRRVLPHIFRDQPPFPPAGNISVLPPHFSC